MTTSDSSDSIPDYGVRGTITVWGREYAVVDDMGRFFMDNPKAVGAPPNWRFGYLPCGCRNNGFGRHIYPGSPLW